MIGYYMGILIGQSMMLVAFTYDPAKAIAWWLLSLGIGMAFYIELLFLKLGIQRHLQKTSRLKESHGTHEVGRKS